MMLNLAIVIRSCNEHGYTRIQHDEMEWPSKKVDWSAEAFASTLYVVNIVRMG